MMLEHVISIMHKLEACVHGLWHVLPEAVQQVA